MDYECPYCGSEGPHTVLSDDGDVMILECAEPTCHREIELADWSS